MEDDRLREPLLPRALLGVSSYNVHYFGRKSVFECQPNPRKRVPNMLAVVGLDRLAAYDLKFHELADVGEQRAGYEVVAVDRRLVPTMTVIKHLVNRDAHVADRPYMVYKCNLNVFSKQREWDTAQQLFGPTPKGDRLLPARNSLRAQIGVTDFTNFRQQPQDKFTHISLIPEFHDVALELKI